ncbi:MAG: VanZ family protein [Bacilli bacterium]|nr:VanZ family protein [Bacilli bacterium]
MGEKIILLITTVFFYFVITEVTEELNIFYPHTNILLTILFAITIFSVRYQKISLTAYLLFILCFLFYRNRIEDNINLEFYLWDWLKLAPKNRIVFINIFGNLLLFAPLAFYIHGKHSFFIIFGIVLVLEFMQLVTKRGVFDVVDIFLNIVGIAFGMVLRRLYGKQRFEKKEKE